MCDQTRKRAAKISDRQRELMLEFMETNPQMISNKFTPTFTKKTCDTLWEKLTLKLNSDGLGATKDTKKWKKSFTDWKSDTKTKAGNLKKPKTGGGERPSTELTELELRLLALVGSICVEGNPNVPEAGFRDFQMDEDPNGPQAVVDSDNQGIGGNERAKTSSATLDDNLILTHCETSVDNPLTFMVVADKPEKAVSNSSGTEKLNSDSTSQQPSTSGECDKLPSNKTPNRKRKHMDATRFETASTELIQTERDKNDILRGIQVSLEKHAVAQEAIASAEASKAVSIGVIANAICDFVKNFKK